MKSKNSICTFLILLFYFQIAVLIANGIAQLLQPSVYDSIIQIKKLPYLPDILTATSGAYNIYVEDFMVRDVKYIWYGITYRQLKNILKEHKKIRSLPLVDSPGKFDSYLSFLYMNSQYSLHVSQLYSFTIFINRNQ